MLLKKTGTLKDNHTMKNTNTMRDNHMNIEIIRSARKTIALEITRDLRVLVRAPYRLPDKDIHRLLEAKASWLEKHMKLMKERIKTEEQQKQSITKFTLEEIRQLANRALTAIPERVAYYAPIVGVQYGRITIRNQVSRWGSCSGKGNLNFNCLLMLTPPDVIDYVVVHELCHRKELNHSKKFWGEVARVLPDYEAPKKWLKNNGSAIIQRLR